MKYYIVLDLEMCRVAGKKAKEIGLKNEIIQIGAVMLDKDYNIVDGFDTFVRPEYGRVDRIIQNLTGISQRKVEYAPTLDEAMRTFRLWLPEEDYIIVSWSMSDRWQLAKELGAKRIHMDWILEAYADWYDCQKLFGKRLGSRRQFRLLDALVASDIISDGEEHNGMVDAYNTALLYAKLSTDLDYNMNEYFVNAVEEKKTPTLWFSLADSLSGLNLQLMPA